MASPEGGSTDVFVSYSRSDQEFVRALVAALAAQEKKAWVDWEAIPPTAEWLAEIHAAIEASDAFLFVISPDSSSSTMCRAELAHAEQLGKRIVPVNIRLVDPADLPPALAELQWITFDDGRSFDDSVEELVETLDTDIEWVREHTHWLAKAREWERSGRDRSFLLRGSELRSAESWLTTPGAAAKEPPATPLHNEFVFAGRQAAIRRQRMFVASVATALLVTFVLAVVAFLQRNQAISERRTAVSELLASASRERLDTSLDTALLLAAAAYDTRKTTAARDALLAAVRRTENVERVFRVHGPGIARSAVSGDGRTLATSTADELALFDVLQGTRIVTIAVPGPTPFALAEDGSLLATVEKGRVVIREVSRPDEVRPLPAAPRNALSVAFAPGRHLLAVGTRAGRIWLRDFDNAKASATLGVEKKGPLPFLVFDAEGDTLAAGSPFGTHVIDVRGKPRYEGLRESDPVRSLAFADSKTLAVVIGSAGRLAVIGARSGLPVCRTRLANLSFVHVDVRHRMIVGGRDGAIRLGADLCRNSRRLPKAHRSSIATIGSVRANGQLVSVDSSGLAVVADIGGFHLTQRQSTGLAFATGIVHGWAAGDVVVSGGSDVLLVGSGRSAERLEGSPEEAGALVAAPSNFVLAAAGATASLWIGRDYAPAPRPGKQPGASVALSPDGGVLAVGRVQGGIVDLWDVPRNTRLMQLRTGGDGSVTALAFSPDGQIAAGDNEGRVVIWNDDRERTVVKSPFSVEALAFAPNGHLAVAGGSEITLWDRSQARRLVLPTQGTIEDVAFTPDGEELVSGDEDGRLVVWDAGTARPLGGPLRMGEPIGAIDMAASGRSLAAVGNAGTVFRVDWSLWNAEAARSRICAIAGRTLTENEWDETAPGLPRPKTC